MTLLNFKTLVFPFLISFGTFLNFSNTDAVVLSYENTQSEMQNPLNDCIADCQDDYVAARDALYLAMYAAINDCITYGDPNDPNLAHTCTVFWEAQYLPRIDLVTQAYWDCDCHCRHYYNGGVGCQN